jgi:hypothetical protein
MADKGAVFQPPGKVHADAEGPSGAPSGAVAGTTLILIFVGVGADRSSVGSAALGRGREGLGSRETGLSKRGGGVVPGDGARPPRRGLIVPGTPEGHRARQYRSR